MRRMLLYIIALALIVTGCSSDSIATEEIPVPDQPDNSDTPAPNKQPTSIEGEVISGKANVESIDILILESFPVQIHVMARGYHPDGCTTIDHVGQERDGYTFRVTITTVRPNDQMCTEAIVPFEQNIPLDVYGLEAGNYTVVVNGVSSMFTLESDNIMPEPPENPENPGSSQPPDTLPILAFVQDVDVQVVFSDPPKVQLTIRGYLPDPCYEIINISERQRGSDIFITVEAVNTVSPGMACVQVIEEFEEIYTLQARLGPGTYTLYVNDFMVQFEI